MPSYSFFFIFGVIVPWLKTSLQFLTDNRLDTTILTAFIILILSGIIIRALEPQIDNIADGMWWAWVTISTVGYGDITPVSTLGRIIASALMIMGIGFIATITAAVSSHFISSFNDNEITINELGEKLGMLDFDLATKTTGARFVFVKDKLALMERAITNFMLDTHIHKNSYKEILN